LALLSMQNIQKSFFGISANSNVSIEVEKGEIHALLGENGAGKTTLMNILYGIYSLDSGTIFWKGKKVSFSTPREAIQNRIGMVHQHFMLVPTLTVSENITLGLKTAGYPFTRRRKLNYEIHNLSRKYGLDINPEALVSDLSVGEEQRVEIIKLLYRNAELLILDEPTAVLTPPETERFFEILKRLKSEGHGVILITHRIPEVMAVTDRITVLRDGCNIGDVETSQIDSRELSRMMIGRDLNVFQRAPEQKIYTHLPPGLKVQNLRYVERGLEKLKNLSFTIQSGEILGIAGVDGNGQKELAECILGIKKNLKGKIEINGRAVGSLSISDRKAMGLAYISDDRHKDGLILEMSLMENFLMNLQKSGKLIKHGIIDFKKCRYAAGQAVETYNIKTPGIDTPISLLSGGNQQKLILARELAYKPSLVIAFQPTRGLDIGAAEFIRLQLIDLKRKGCSILLISTDLDEILSLSDRIGVMSEGRIMKIMENEGDVDLTELGLLMGGQDD